MTLAEGRRGVGYGHIRFTVEKSEKGSRYKIFHTKYDDFFSELRLFKNLGKRSGDELPRNFLRKCFSNFDPVMSARFPFFEIGGSEFEHSF